MKTNKVSRNDIPNLSPLAAAQVLLQIIRRTRELNYYHALSALDQFGRTYTKRSNLDPRHSTGIIHPLAFANIVVGLYKSRRLGLCALVLSIIGLVAAIAATPAVASLAPGAYGWMELGAACVTVGVLVSFLWVSKDWLASANENIRNLQWLDASRNLNEYLEALNHLSGMFVGNLCGSFNDGVWHDSDSHTLDTLDHQKVRAHVLEQFRGRVKQMVTEGVTPDRLRWIRDTLQVLKPLGVIDVTVVELCKGQHHRFIDSVATMLRQLDKKEEVPVQA
jgi:hypothetical protein